MVGVAFDQVVVDSLEALFGYLRPSRVIEKYGRTFQCGELPANEIDACTQRRRCFECHGDSFKLDGALAKARCAVDYVSRLSLDTPLSAAVFARFALPWKILQAYSHSKMLNPKDHKAGLRPV